MEQILGDDVLIQTLRDGSEALPDDLERLHAFVMLISGLLAEKAVDHEPSWDLALAAGAEIETLHDLEQAAAYKAVDVPASSVHNVLTKLAIWHALESPGEEGGEMSVRDRLILSIRRDLESIAGTGVPRCAALART